MRRTYAMETDTITEPEEKLTFLFNENVLFINNGHWDKSWPTDKITVHVLCNDIFAWGCADAEDLAYSEIDELYEMYLKDENYGAAAFCIKKRKMRPQTPVKDQMDKAGIWDIEELLK